MLALGANDREAFAANADACGRVVDGGEPWFCSASCETLAGHVLVVPNDPYETWDAAVERTRATLPVRLPRRLAF